MRQVTERDLRAPEFAEGEPSEYEFRDDGKIVRKDRWERGVRSIAATLGTSRSFEIKDIVREVQTLVDMRDSAAAIDFCHLIDELLLSWNGSKGETEDVRQRRIDARVALEAAIAKVSGRTEINEG